jgi:methionine-R-sulfoxide reductase
MRTTTLIIIILALGLTSCGQTPKSQAKNNDKMEHNNDKKYQVQKSEQDWKKDLSTDQYYVLREKGTERAFTGKFYLHKDKGTYTCAACGNELFTSEMKFDSHCGWPSFDREIAGGKVVTHTDTTFGMVRTEIMCGRCGGHLGHIFDDGPTATGQRYCVNSLSLEFSPADTTQHQHK